MITGGILAVRIAFSWRRLNERAILLFGSVGLMLLSSLVAGIIAHAGLRLKRPFVDRALQFADWLLMIDTPAWVFAVSRHPVMAHALAAFYNSTVPVVIITAFALSIVGTKDRTWELVYAYSAGIIICSLIFAAFPAIGTFAFAGINPETAPGLPVSAGRFHLKAVEYYRYGSAPVVDIAKFNGVVTFPSFHTIMAIIVAYALRGFGALSYAAALWSALVIVSTVPIGGHFVIDIIGGGSLRLALLLLAKTLARPKSVRATVQPK